MVLDGVHQEKVRIDEDHTVDVASVLANIVTNKKTGLGFGIRLEAVTVDQSLRDIQLEDLEKRAFLVIQVRPGTKNQ